MSTSNRRFGLLSCVTALVIAASSQAAIDDAGDALRGAAASGNLEAVRSAITSGVDVNSSRSDGWTALHAAAERSQTRVLRELIAADADVNARGFLGVTPLHWAAIRGPLEAVQALIEADANVNVHSTREHTPLGAAASAGNTEIAAALIRAGADVNGGDWMTPLSLATKHARVEVIELLTQNGATINDARNPPLHWAGEAEAAEALIKAGANVNIRDEKGRTALHLTTGHWIPKAEAIKVLLAAGADVNARSRSGSTPMHEAIRHQKLDIVNVLIVAEADVDARDDNGNTPLSLAREMGDPFVAALVAAGAKDDGLTELQRAALDGNLARVEALIENGADVNERGPRRTTAVHVASERGHADVIRALIQAHARVNVYDEPGMTPLHLAANAAVAKRLIAAGAQVATAKLSVPPLNNAVAEGRADVVKVLVDHGAEVDGPGGPGMLAWAAFFGHADVVKTLLNSGAKTEPQGGVLNESALHIVASGSFADMSCPEHVTPEARQEVAELLVARGANVNASANKGYFDGFTPLHGAARSGHTGIAELLIKHGANVNAASPTGMFVGCTPLHAAAQGGHVAIVRVLLRHVAEVNAKTGEQYFDGVLTPLDMTESAEVRELLKEHDGRSATD